MRGWDEEGLEVWGEEMNWYACGETHTHTHTHTQRARERTWNPGGGRHIELLPTLTHPPTYPPSLPPLTLHPTHISTLTPSFNTTTSITITFRNYLLTYAM